jgi:hypothetical protein
MEHCHVIVILMAHLALSVKNLVGNVCASQMLLGDVVRPVVLDFMVFLTANHVIVLQLHSARLTQVKFKQELVIF